MDVDFTKVATSEDVCKSCCERRKKVLGWGTTLEWGTPEPDDYEEPFDGRDSFYCPVLDRRIYNPENVGTVQPDCPRKFEHAKAAGVVVGDIPKEVQMRLFELEHNSYHPGRLKHGMEERVYLTNWQTENKRSPGLNHGYTLLEHILCPPEQRYPEAVSQRDAYVAASVIQWLGTYCGCAFVSGCERTIRKDKSLQSYLEQKNVV